jgi:hypothetical protein
VITHGLQSSGISTSVAARLRTALNDVVELG